MKLFVLYFSRLRCLKNEKKMKKSMQSCWTDDMDWRFDGMKRASREKIHAFMT